MIEPIDRSPELEKTLDKLTGAPSAVRAGLCVSCKGVADLFDNEQSEREYTISGLCQACQDKAFAYEIFSDSDSIMKPPLARSPDELDAEAGVIARAIDFLQEVRPGLARQLTLERLTMIQIVLATRDDAYHCGYKDGFTFANPSMVSEEHLPAALALVKQCYNYKPRIASDE